MQAVEYLQQAIQSDPDLTDGHLLLGQLFEKAGNPMARKYYDNAIRVDPDNAEAKMALANYYWMANDYENALNEYDRLLAAHNDFSRGYFNQGLIYLELDSLDKASRGFHQAILNDKDFIQAHYYLGETYRMQNDWQQARASLEEAARLSPSDSKIKKSLQEVIDKMNSQ